MHCDFCYMVSPEDGYDGLKWARIYTHRFTVEVIDPINKVVTEIRMSPEWLACPPCAKLFEKRDWEKMMNRNRVNDPDWHEGAQEAAVALWERIAENLKK